MSIYKRLIVIYLIAIIALVYIPVYSRASETKDIVWDSSTDVLKLPPVIAEDENLLIKDGAFLESPFPINVTIYGRMESQNLRLVKFKNINLVFNTQEKITLKNIDLNGAIEIKNGDIEITRSRIVNESETGIVASQNSNISLYDNDISGCQNGVEMLDNSNGVFRNNNFHGNKTAIKNQSEGQIIIDNNNFFDNGSEDNFTVENLAEKNISAFNNWWGCEKGATAEAKMDNCSLVSKNVDFSNFKGQFILDKGDIIFSEIMTNPSTAPTIPEQKKEWIEIYNNLFFEMPLDVQIYDGETYKEELIGAVFQPRAFSIIPADKIIFLDRYPDLTSQVVEIPKHTLSDNSHYIGNGLSAKGGKITLAYSGSEIDSVDYTETMKEDQTFSLFDNHWEWTSAATPGKENQADIVVTPTPIPSPTLTPTPLPVTLNNNCPETIQINQANSYINCRVTISGKVRKSYGSYFYIYDETGDLKVYLQAAKKIKKPRLFANTKIKVSGILDRYKTGLRLLPEKSNDIELIENAIAAGGKTPDNGKVAVTPSSNVNNVAAEFFETGNRNNYRSEDILPAVKGATDIKTEPISNHLLLKYGLFLSMIVLVAITSYNLGAKNGANKPQQ